jgi:EmrB/QacA subfamily drug resistance transporter
MSPTKKTKWWLLLVTTSGTALTFFDNTVMPVALPTIQKELLFHPVGLVWVVNAYLLSLTALLLIGGRLCDMYGKRSLFIWGLLLFGLGSLLAAFSHTRWFLLLGRVVQGAGGALTIPTTGAMLVATFPEGERARAIGINTGISAIFLILGPALGGFLTQYISWRSIFFLNIPLVIFGIIMAAIILKPEERKKEKFHFAGAFTMLIGVVGVVVGLMQANEWGWSSPWILTLIFVSPLFFALFIWISIHNDHPIIDFNFFRNPLFTAANISVFITQVIVMVTVLWAIYFQQQLHYSPLQTGLMIFVAAFPVFLMAPLGGYFADRFGSRLPLLMGYSILIFALFWLFFTVHSQDLLMLLPGLLGFGCGLPMILSPTIALALSQIEPKKLGAAAGINTEIRQLASTIGIAMMTAVYHSAIRITGSEQRGFSAISLLSSLFAIAGFCVVFFMVKKVRQPLRIKDTIVD